MLRFLLPLFFFSTHVVAQTAQWSVVTEDAPPLQFIVDGEVKGVSTRLVNDVLKQANIDADIEVYPWARAFDKALKYKNTLIFSTIRTPERESQFHWIGKIGRFHLSFMGLKQNTAFNIGSTSDAKQFVIGAMRDDFTHQYLVSNGFTNEGLVIRSSLPELMDLLYKGLIDSFLVDRNLVCDLAEHYQFDCDKMRVAYEVPELSVDVYLAANQYTDEAEIGKLRKAFEIVKQRPEYQEGFAGHN
ncbi:substrate-binding periplasmic protein [Alteromonas facilis]|uniref:substrate-binding periplasmic protein n=1 Tax=Alteromonas facilis TaxID=2048004 RepID=UPI000C29221D|nr:transporter substrate-binding domain-containing protein [Alteromonas facilis]